MLFAADNVENLDIEANVIMPERSSKEPTCHWNNDEHLHDLCLQKYIVQGKICALILSVTDTVAGKICADEATNTDQDILSSRSSLAVGQMTKIARFCLNQLDKIMMQNCFAWDDVLVSFFFISWTISLSIFLHSYTSVHTGI